MHPNKGDRGMCAREGCQFLRHTKQGHGYCCGSCKEAKPQGHGGKCQKVQPDYRTREGCTFLAHPDRKHGFCCGRCKNKGEGHGKNCWSARATAPWPARMEPRPLIRVLAGPSEPTSS